MIRSFLADNESAPDHRHRHQREDLLVARPVLARIPGLFAGLTKLDERPAFDLQEQPDAFSGGRRQHQHGQVQEQASSRTTSPTGAELLRAARKPTPMVNGHFQIPQKYRCFNDGAALTSDPCAQRKRRSSGHRSSRARSVAERKRAGEHADRPELRAPAGPGSADRHHAGGAAPRGGGDGEMRGLLSPLIKLIAFLVVTSFATYVLAATIANTSYGATQYVQGRLHRRARAQHRRRRSGRRRPGRHRELDRHRPAQHRRGHFAVEKARPLPDSVRSTCATATWSASATSTSSQGAGDSTVQDPSSRSRPAAPARRST